MNSGVYTQILRCLLLSPQLVKKAYGVVSASRSPVGKVFWEYSWSKSTNDKEEAPGRVLCAKQLLVSCVRVQSRRQVILIDGASCGYDSSMQSPQRRMFVLRSLTTSTRELYVRLGQCAPTDEPPGRRLCFARVSGHGHHICSCANDEVDRQLRLEGKTRAPNSPVTRRLLTT